MVMNLQCCASVPGLNFTPASPPSLPPPTFWWSGSKHTCCCKHKLWYFAGTPTHITRIHARRCVCQFWYAKPFTLGFVWGTCNVSRLILTWAWCTHAWQDVPMWIHDVSRRMSVLCLYPYEPYVDVWDSTGIDFDSRMGKEVLEKSMYTYYRKHPNAGEQDLFILWSTPHRWFFMSRHCDCGDQFSDLTAMITCAGLPSLFLSRLILSCLQKVSYTKAHEIK